MKTRPDATPTQPPTARRRFDERFAGPRPVLLAIAEIGESDNAASLADDLQTAGADGLFLLNRGIGYQRLIRIARHLAARHHEWFIGLGCRDLRPQDVICRLTPDISGLWIDRAGSPANQSIDPAAISAARQEIAWPGLIFAGPKQGQCDTNNTPPDDSAIKWADVIVSPAGDTTGTADQNMNPTALDSVAQAPIQGFAVRTGENITPGISSPTDCLVLTAGAPSERNESTPQLLRTLREQLHTRHDSTATVPEANRHAPGVDCHH